MSQRTIQLRILLYVSTLVIHVGHIVYLLNLDMIHHKDPQVRQFAALQLRYFTCWNFFLQIANATVGIICEVLTLKNSNKKNYQLPKRLNGFRNTLFSGILWPSTCLVVTFFWFLFLYDRDLILPAYVDQVISPLSNHIIHTFILPILLLEILLRPIKEPRSHKKNINVMTIHMLVYISVMVYTFVERGLWIYPIFKVIYGTVYFPILFAVLSVICLLTYYMQWVIIRNVWKPTTTRLHKKQE